MQRRRWRCWIKAQESWISAAAKGVAGLVLQQQQRIGTFRCTKQTLLQLLLPIPCP
jgi:hypothetical protein